MTVANDIQSPKTTRAKPKQVDDLAGASPSMLLLELGRLLMLYHGAGPRAKSELEKISSVEAQLVRISKKKCKLGMLLTDGGRQPFCIHEARIVSIIAYSHLCQEVKSITVSKVSELAQDRNEDSTCSCQQ